MLCLASEGLINVPRLQGDNAKYRTPFKRGETLQTDIEEVMRHCVETETTFLCLVKSCY